MSRYISHTIETDYESDTSSSTELDCNPDVYEADPSEIGYSSDASNDSQHDYIPDIYEVAIPSQTRFSEDRDSSEDEPEVGKGSERGAESSHSDEPEMTVDWRKNATSNNYQTRMSRNVEQYAQRKAKQETDNARLRAKYQEKLMYFNYDLFYAEAYDRIVKNYYAKYWGFSQTHCGYGQRADKDLAAQMSKKRGQAVREQSPSTTSSKSSMSFDGKSAEANVLDEGRKGVEKKSLTLYQKGKKQWGDMKWGAAAKKAEMLFLLKEDGMDISEIINLPAKEIVQALHAWKAGREDRKKSQKKSTQAAQEPSEDGQPQSRKRKLNEDDANKDESNSRADAELARPRKKARHSKLHHLHNLSHEVHPIPNPRVVLISITKCLSEQPLAPEPKAAQSPKSRSNTVPSQTSSDYGLGLLQQTVIDMYCDENKEVCSISSPSINDGEEHRPFAFSAVDQNTFEIWGDSPILYNVFSGIQDALRSRDSSLLGESKELRTVLADGLDDAKRTLAGDGHFTYMDIEVD